MDKKDCRVCYYSDFCASDEVCDNYAPVGEISDDVAEDLIERGRIEFREDFFRYIEDRGV